MNDKATDILASKLILNLNEPSRIGETSRIKPMKFVGVWWEMQTSKSSWSYANSADTLNAAGQLIAHGHHGANTAILYTNAAIADWSTNPKAYHISKQTM